jgi:beta-alanine degradation protein BauB
VAAAGRTEAPITAGESYFRKAGVEHDVRNETPRDIVFIEVEMKGGRP